MDTLEKWAAFEKSGRISDYLEYCGYNMQCIQELKNENNQWNCNKTA